MGRNSSLKVEQSGSVLFEIGRERRGLKAAPPRLFTMEGEVNEI